MPYAFLTDTYDTERIKVVSVWSEFTDQELRVIRNVSSLPTEKLTELLKVYEKLDNVAMMQTSII